jgi:UrcA family protein
MNISRYQTTSLRLAAILCITLAAGLSVPTQAADLVNPDIAVRYDSVAIESEQGAAQLLKRIEGAAGRVCARLDHGDLASRTKARACSRKLTADAVIRVNHPMLLAVYNSAGRVAPSVARLTQ